VAIAWRALIQLVAQAFAVARLALHRSIRCRVFCMLDR
jgi:hypothetical protein